MRRTLGKLRRDLNAAVAPTVALSLFGLMAAGGIAFDYARMASLDTELQQAADQAALAAATQLDGQAGALSRANAAARSLISNETLFANDSGGLAADVDAASDTQAQGYTPDQQAVVFYKTRADAEADANGFDVASGRDSEAHFVRIRIETRSAHFALTPVVGALSANMSAQATAGLGSAICKVPPVMICNPAEPAGNGNERLAYNPTRGIGLRLVTGDATVPGNFGWLDAGLGSGAPALGAALGYNAPPGDCQPIDGVTTKTGMTTSVLDAFNTRFDIFANGASTCPAGGTCSPAANTRKDLVCNSPGGVATCSAGWSRANNFYKLPTDSISQTTCNGGGKCTTTTTNVTSERALKAGDTYPSMMGYPHDLCQADVEGAGSNAGACAIQGNGTWDRDAYFKVNYNWDNATWQSNTGLHDGTGGTTAASRWDVYQWELTHQSVINGTKSYGIAVPQQDGSGNSYGHGIPAQGVAGVSAGATQADRRRISAAVLNCIALNAHGKTVGVPVANWLDLFLVEPALKRDAPSSAVYTSAKDIYVEVIGVTTAAGNNSAGQVVRRDLPYLVK